MEPRPKSISFHYAYWHETYQKSVQLFTDEDEGRNIKI